MKKLGIGIAIILVICLILLVAAPFLVDLDRYKTPIIEQVQSHINRDIDFEHIELTILTGLGAEIQGLRISDNPAFSKDDFLRLDRVQVKVELLPLFKKEVRIKSVILKKPVLSIARNAEGVFSFDDIIDALKKGPEEKVSGNSGSPVHAGEPAGGGTGGVAWAAGSEGEEASASAVPIPVLLDNFKILDGTVLYRDEMTLPGAAPLVIDMLDITARDVSLDTPVDIDLSADVLKSGRKNVYLAGTVGPLGKSMDVNQAPFNVKFSLKSTALSKLPTVMPVKIDSGMASAEIVAQGSLGTSVASEAIIDVVDFVFRGNGKDEGRSSGKVNAKLTGTVSLDYQNKNLSIERAALTLNENALTLKGKVEDFLTEPRWEITTDTATLDPAALIALFPQYAGTIPGELVLEGPAEIRIASSGKMTQFDIDAGVETTKMGIVFGEVFRKPKGTPLSVAMKGKRKGNTFFFDAVDLVLHNLKARASGNLQFKEDAPKYTFDLAARPVALDGWDELVPLLTPYDLKGDIAVNMSAVGIPDTHSLTLEATSDELKFSVPPPKDGATAKAPEPGMVKGIKFNLKSEMKKVLRSRGVLAVDSGEVRSIPFALLASEFIHDPEQITIKSFSVAAFDGVIKGKGSYGFETQEWQFTPSVERVDVNAILAALTEHKGIFFGKLSGNVKAGGGPKTGKTPLIRSQGDIVLAQGEWKNFSLVDSVLESLFGLKGISQFISYGGAGAAQHVTTKFDSLDGTFDMNGNIVKVKPLVLRNIQTSKETDSVARLEGTVDILQKTLDMKGAVILSKRHSEKLTRKAGILKALVNNDNMMVLPITLKGAIRKPVPFLDVEYVMNALSNYYMKQGLDRGLEKLKEKLGPAGNGDGPGKAVEEILKGFF